MEVILGDLSNDASAGKLKAITDACDEGLEALSRERVGRPVEAYELREKCLLPLKLALESRVSKLASHALVGFHKLISDERFQSLMEGDVHRQLPVQFVNAVVSTPSMSDEIQVEIMKMLLMITCSASCEVHGEYLIKIAEVCIETYVRSNQSWTKTACRATLTQMMSSVCNDLEESLKKVMLPQHSKELPHIVRGLDLISTDSSKVLTQDVLMLMKHFCSRLSPNQGHVQLGDSVSLYLEATYVIVSSVSIAIRQEKDFINVLWQYLCPTLIHLLGSPVTDVGTRPWALHHSPEDAGRGGRGAGSPLKARPALQSAARIIYSISKELVRLVGSLSTMRPVLESLFHRIILYPPTQQRGEALKALNEIFSSPSHVVDIAGPLVVDANQHPSPDSPTEQKKSEVDLLKVLLDGIMECSRAGDLNVVGGSVACVVALLGSLEELSQGEGLSHGQLELLSKLEDVDGWEKVEKEDPAAVGVPHVRTEESPQTIPKFTVADEPFDGDERREAHVAVKPKHIRWEMDEDSDDSIIYKQMPNLETLDFDSVTRKFVSEDRLWDLSRTNPDGREQDATEEPFQPKSVHFAADLEEEFTIENREDQRSGRYGYPPRSSVPRRTAAAASAAKRAPLNKATVRRSASFDGKSKSRPVIQPGDRRRGNSDNATVNKVTKRRPQLQRSNSDLGNSPTEEHHGNGTPGDAVASGHRSILRKPTEQEEKPVKPKGILLNPNLSDAASKKVKINGMLVSRSRDARAQVSPEKPVFSPMKVAEKRKSVEENEKEGARNFARCLLGILPSVLSLHDPVAVDDALQQFASDVCEAVTCMALRRKNVPNFGTLRGSSDLLDDESGKGATSYLHYPILNADSVYAAVYATLKLNLKLHRAQYYTKKTQEDFVTQDEFVKNIHNSGVEIGLSSVWLGELHRLVTTYDILDKAGYKADDVSSNRALIELLSDDTRLARTADEKGTDSPVFMRIQDQSSMTVTQKQGVKFVRRILLLTWDSLLEVLRVPIESPLIGPLNESIGVALMMAFEGKKRQLKERDTICLSLDGLRRIARLFCTLGIKTGCETVLSQLANASCGGGGGNGEENIMWQMTRSKGDHRKTPRMKLHAAHVLTMDAMLAVGLELGSHAPKCWKHVFRCCSYIADLQNKQFDLERVEMRASHKGLDLSSPASETSPTSEAIDHSSDDSASDIVQRRRDDAPDTTGVLNPGDASRAVYALSNSVDRLFERAANTLSCDAMVAMLGALAVASSDQLDALNDHTGQRTLGKTTWPANLHFCRMVDLLVRCARDGKRPLLHLIRAWLIFSDHFVKVVCDDKRNDFRFALDLVKDALVVLLNNRNELAHFWFHETLFKPFVVILGNEKFDETDQEEILDVLSQLVNTNTSSIRSGWRAVCCATRAIRFLPRPSQLIDNQESPAPSIVMQILSSFAENRTALVFSQAAVDCILCLSKCLHIQPGGEDASDEPQCGDTDSVCSGEGPYGDMCLPALDLLSKMAKKLALIHVKPANVIFHGSHAVKLDNSSSPLSSPSSPLMSVADTVQQAKALAPNYAHSITAMDHSGILRVWYLLLDVLTTTVITCPRRHQLQALDALFEVLADVCTTPGPQFAILALTHLLLPMLHTWLQRGVQNPSYWRRTTGNFKQACGLTTELIVREMKRFLEHQAASECVPTLMKQVLDLLKTAVSQPEEVIARVGCSCFRHLLMSGGTLFTEEIWQIVCHGLRDAMRLTLAPVKLLIPCYHVGSSNVSGDEGCCVRVLTRRDSSWEQTIRHGQLAEQVFLLESQLQEEFERSNDEGVFEDDDDQRSYFFVISSADNVDKPDETSRIGLRDLVVGLLAHQLLLQSLNVLLLDSRDGAAHVMPAAAEDHVTPPMSGLLCCLSPGNLSVVFDCLMESHTTAYEFNARFGLRSLLQMIVRLCAPANLLRQSTMAFKVYLLTLLEICRYNGEHLSASTVKRILVGSAGMADGDDLTPGEAHGDKGPEWIVRRLSEACSQLTSVYNRLYMGYNACSDDPVDRHLTSTPLSSPAKLHSHFGDEPSKSSTRFVVPPTQSGNSPGERHYLQAKSDDDLLQLKTWTAMAVDMIEALLRLPTLQFKPILPAIYPAITSMIPVTGDPRVCRLIYDVVLRVGSIYGII